MEKGRTETARKVEDVPEISYNVAPRILLIVTNKDSLDANKEVPLKNYLENTFDVTIEVAQSDTDIDSGNWDLKPYDLIICCNGVTPTDVNNLKTVEAPVLSLDEDVSVTALNMASTGGNSASETQTNATDITQQIISEALRDIDPTSIATGNKTVYSAASGVDYITTLGTGGVSLSEDVGTATEEHIVVYDEDAALQDATLAEEIRIHFGLYQFNKLTATGRALFRHAVEYAIYGPMGGAKTQTETILEYLKSRPNTKLFSSDLQASLTLPAAAANQSLPSVTLPAVGSGGIPVGATIDAVYCHFIYGHRKDTSAADNKISGDQYIQVKESVSGSYTNCLKLVDDSLLIDISESTVIGGQIIYGNIDVKAAEVSAFNQIYNFQWTSAVVDGASMILYDIQMVIEVRWH